MEDAIAKKNELGALGGVREAKGRTSQLNQMKRGLGYNSIENPERWGGRERLIIRGGGRTIWLLKKRK